jgi:hypothetical protein
MTIPPNPATARRQTRRHTLVEVGHAPETTGDTDAWEHETFGEEHARLERADPEGAEICETVRRAKDKREQASLSADKTKPGGTLGLPSREGRTTSRCCDPRDTDAVVEGKGVAEVCLPPLGRQLCGRHKRRVRPRAMRSAARPRIARELAN